ncbi:transposase [Mesorhizobium sp. WSM2240]
MTIASAILAVAAGIVAAIGGVSRFNRLQNLMGFFALNPRSRTSGSHEQGRPRSRARNAGRGATASGQDVRWH